MTGYFEVKQGKSDKFSFNLKSGNHKVILTSQAYASKEAAMVGVASVQENSVNDAHFGRLTAKNNAPYFVLKAGNGEVIGKSEMYSGNSGMEKGITSVKENGATKAIRYI